MPLENSSPSPGLLIVLSGPSGVGKDTVLEQLRSKESRLLQITTVTTRLPRPKEVAGQDYHFVSEEDFQSMLDQGRFLEHAIVYGHSYGVPKDAVMEGLRNGCDVVLRTDVQGASTIKGLAPEALFIFLAPASEKELEARVRRRLTESHESHQLRLRTVKQEMKASEMFDYVVVNRKGELRSTIAEIRSILEKERGRIPPRRVLLQ